MPDEDALRSSAIDGLVPGPERRRALRQAGFNIALADFTDEERQLRWGITRRGGTRPTAPVRVGGLEGH